MNRNIIIIIQVRLDSSRLPGKAMLWTPIGPLFVAVALRARSYGKHVIIATSDDSNGELVAKIASDFGITVYQGPKEDVLSRFVGASMELTADGTVVRLTGDNLLPDSELIDSMLYHFEKTKMDYVSTNTKGTPYGLSVEVFKKSVLDEANRYAVKPYDREHVTSWILRNELYKKQFIIPEGVKENWQNLRVTIDTLQDYINWIPVFSSKMDIANSTWYDLINRFVLLSNN